MDSNGGHAISIQRDRTHPGDPFRGHRMRGTGYRRLGCWPVARRHAHFRWHPHWADYRSSRNSGTADGWTRRHNPAV